MTASTITAILDAVYYGARQYSRISNLRLYPSLSDVLDGGLSSLFCLFPTLLESIRQFGAKAAERGSCYRAGYAGVLFH